MNVGTHRTSDHQRRLNAWSKWASVLAYVFLSGCVGITRPSNGATVAFGPVLAEVVPRA